MTALVGKKGKQKRGGGDTPAERNINRQRQAGRTGFQRLATTRSTRLLEPGAGVCETAYPCPAVSMERVPAEQQQQRARPPRQNR